MSFTAKKLLDVAFLKARLQYLTSPQAQLYRTETAYGKLTYINKGTRTQPSSHQKLKRENNCGSCNFVTCCPVLLGVVKVDTTTANSSPQLMQQCMD